VARHGSLVEQRRFLQTRVAANKFVIIQSSNTGVTGGSTLDGVDCDRGVMQQDPPLSVGPLSWQEAA
jgi:D-lactate dehydrogenase